MFETANVVRILFDCSRLILQPNKVKQNLN